MENDKDVITLKMLPVETETTTAAAATITTTPMMKTEPFDIDAIYKELGVFGTFQIRNYILICLAMVFYSSYTMSYVFTTSRLDYRSVLIKCIYVR